MDNKIKQLESEIKEMEEKKKRLLASVKVLKKKNKNNDVEISNQNKLIVGEFSEFVINNVNKSEISILQR